MVESENAEGHHHSKAEHHLENLDVLEVEDQQTNS
jgi:hypothetical protein